PTSTCLSAPAASNGSPISCCGSAPTPSSTSPTRCGPTSARPTSPPPWRNSTPGSAASAGCRTRRPDERPERENETRPGDPRRGRYAWDYLVAGVTATASACIGVLPLVARDVRWSELPSGGALRYARGASVGALLAFPLLLVLGGLFASADPVFGNLVTNALDVDFTAVASHTSFIAAGTALP